MNRKVISFLIIFFLLIFGLFFVSSRRVPFTNSVNNVQFNNPSVQSIYRGDHSKFWRVAGGESFDESMCGEGTDFALMIPPGGCEPMVVRSDLLAEQNVPVMCQLASVRVNPLIRVSSIRSIGFSGPNPPEVADVSFYPARAGIRSYNTLLEDPLYNNVGYVTIILNRNRDESKMPRFVEGNLTARIAFDAESIHGVGNAILFLEGDGTSEQPAQENFATFWNGVGYVRLLSADSQRARLGVYTREGRLVQEVVLREGETSGKIFLPGYYCRASLRLKLSEFTVPEDSALLNIDGESIWVRRGSRILNGRCTVSELRLFTGDTGKVILNCQGAGRIELSLLGGYSANISLNEVESSYNVSSFVLRGNISKGQELRWHVGFSGLVGRGNSGEGLLVLLGSAGDIKPRSYSDVAQEIKRIEEMELSAGNVDVISAIKQSLRVSGFSKDTNLIILSKDEEKTFTRDNQDIKLNFKGLVDVESPSDAEETPDPKQQVIAFYLNKADEAVKDLLRHYPQVKGNLNRFGEIALLEQINLVEHAGESVVRIALMETFLEKYPDSIYADKINEMLYGERVYDRRNVRESFEINGNFYSIILERFRATDPEKKKASIYVGANFLGALSEGDEANLTRGEASEKLRVSRIYPNRVEVEIFVKGNRGIFSRQSTLTLRLNESLERKINNKDFLFEVSDIDVQTVAKVELLVDEDNRNSEANFSYKIGIEQRLIKLNPNKSSERAERLNRTIEKLEERNNRLGELIRGWKGACLVTGIGLNIKNLVEGASGESLARQEVMKVWRAFCEADKTPTALGMERSLDACYNSFRKEIERDVAAYAKAVDGINEEIAGERNITKFVQDKFRNREMIELEGGAELAPSALRTWEEVRVYMLYEKLKGDSISEGLLASVKAQRDKKLQHLVGLQEEEKQREEDNKWGVSVTNYDEENLEARARSWSGSYFKNFKHNRRGEIKEGSSPYPDNTPIELIRKRVGNLDNKFLLILGGIPIAGSSPVAVKEVWNVTGTAPPQRMTNSPLMGYSFRAGGNCENKIRSPTVSFYESGAVRGLAATVPFDAERGWYVKVSSSSGGFIGSDGQARGYTSAAIPETFTICNVGSDGIQSPDDLCTSVNINQRIGEGVNHINIAGCLLSPNEVNVLMRDAQSAIGQANRQYGSKTAIEIQVGSRKRLTARRGSPQAEDGPIEQCQDFMSPEDCQLMFNVCDPVMCPVSRCNFGGRYPVTNVIQSGIFGSLVLCLPNFKPLGGDVYVPICLTGVHAGIDSYISVLKAQRDCLNENARSGEYVGICDYMTAMYKCNLLWNNIGPFIGDLLPSLFSVVTGRQRAGGGEYLTFQRAWDNMESSLDFFKNTYGSTSFTAFKLGNVEQFGTEICNAYIGTSFPTSAEGLDKMLQPESPYQIYAEFQEIPHTDATVPPTSHYKVFAHIYAGKDRGVSYSIYLKNPPTSSYYAGIPYLGVPRGTGFVAAGDQRQISEDFTAPAGYKELCVSINGKPYCNFGPVTTDFGIDKLTDSFIEKQADQTRITTERECQQGSSGLVGFTSINPQAAITNVVDPRIDLRGIVRICSSVNPGEGTAQRANWEEVGYCGDAAIRCWLDRSSVEESTSKLFGVAGSIRVAEKSLDLINEGGTINEQDSIERIVQIRNMVAQLNVAQNDEKDKINTQINPILRNITELEERGFSQRYQAEAVYWRFRLYERIALALVGEKKNIVKIEVPSASLPLNGEEDPTALPEEKKFSELKIGDLIAKDGITYEVKNTHPVGEKIIVGLAVKGQSAAETIEFNPRDGLSSRGYSWSPVNPHSP